MMHLFKSPATPATASSAVFTFTLISAAAPPLKFTFNHPPPASISPHNSNPFKRRRPLWDVDGTPLPGKKKRRLRLNLITSRLSRPFSAPASNIVDRGVSRIASWARGRRPDKSVLRKAAIMNRVRGRVGDLGAGKQVGQEAAGSPGVYQARKPDREPGHGGERYGGYTDEEHPVRQDTWRLPTPANPRTRTRQPAYHEMHQPLPPSPLGLSNYDALDLEDDDLHDDDMDRDRYCSNDHCGEDGIGHSCGAAEGPCSRGAFYSDFSIMNPLRTDELGEDEDEYAYLDELDGIPHQLPDERPPPPLEEELVEVIKEDELGRERNGGCMTDAARTCILV